jgi:hypothetical protein
MNIVNSTSPLLNNSFTSDTQNICNCLGCNRFADNKIFLKIKEKSITIFVCEDCRHKFKES